MNNIQDEIDLVGESAASRMLCRHRPCRMFCRVVRVFFSAPELFAPRFPALWQRFCQFYRQISSATLRAAEAHHGEESGTLPLTLWVN